MLFTFVSNWIIVHKYNGSHQSPPRIWTSDLADPDPEPSVHRWLPSVSKKHICMCMLGKQSLWSKGMLQNITLLILVMQYICMQFANLCSIQIEHYVRNYIPQCTAAQTDVPWISITMSFWLIISKRNENETNHHILASCKEGVWKY